jgi:phospholipase C
MFTFVLSGSHTYDGTERAISHIREEGMGTRSWSRRDLLKSAALSAVALPRVISAQQASPLPPPNESGIRHIVVLMMENRSYDHFFGWVPESDGRQPGLTYFDTNNQPHSTYHLRDLQGCGFKDPDHSYAGGRIEYNNGLCDGWLKVNDLYSIGYYRRDDFAFYGPAVNHWTVFDRYFSATMAGTFPNKIYQWAAQTDRQENTFELCTLPTIFDSLLATGRTASYYFSDVPFTALWGSKYLSITKPFSLFLSDAASGKLPDIAFVDPRFLGAPQGLSADDHPFSDIRNGQAFINQVYETLARGPGWEGTVFIINYDEWGGFFDHVPPDVAPDNNLAFALRGFRTPAMMIAPWANRKQVSSTVYDHTSILKMIEWRWSLPPLTMRDAAANNIAVDLDFSDKARKNAPRYDVQSGFFGAPCGTTPAVNKWDILRQLAAGFGFVLN